MSDNLLQEQIDALLGKVEALEHEVFSNAGNELDHLQAHVDTLENVLCDLVTSHADLHTILAQDLKRALENAGILSKP